MTCVVGLIDNGVIYMGADSASVDKWYLQTTTNDKVFIRGEYIIGIAGSWRMGQLLQYSLEIPPHPKGVGTFKYMVNSFVEATRKCLKDGGCAEKVNESESLGDIGVFLVGHQGRLFQIDKHYQVEENLLPYDAVGCVPQVALGVLYANEHLKPGERVLQALEAAEQFSGGVRRPFAIKSL